MTKRITPTAIGRMASRLDRAYATINNVERDIHAMIRGDYRAADTEKVRRLEEASSLIRAGKSHIAMAFTCLDSIYPGHGDET